MSEKAPLTRTISAISPGVATANADDTFMIAEAPYGCTVTGVSFTPDTAITGAATNNRRLALINRKSNGAGTTVVAEITFDNGINGVAGDEKALTLTGTAADLALNAGDILAWFSDANGTGIADPGGLVQVEIARG